MKDAPLLTERRLRRQNEALVALTRQPLKDDLIEDIHRITEVAAHTLGVARCGMWLYADDRTALLCVDGFDAVTGTHSRGASISRTKYPAYFAAMEADRTIAVADAHHDPRTCAFSSEYLTPQGIGAMLDAPVRVNGKTLGVLCLEHLGGVRPWTADEEGFVESVGTLVAVAIESNERTRTLAESERFARSTVDALTAHIAIIDDTGEILAINQSWRQFAASNGLLMPQYGLGGNYLHVCDTGGPEGAAAAEGIRAVLRESGDRFDLEYPCHSPDEQRWFAMRVTRFSGEGPTRLVICHENITERKQNEMMLNEQVSLRNAVAAMEQVLGVVGHELRTPLAGLRAMSEYLLTDGARETEEANEFLSAMNQEVIRMGDTVDELLEAARLNSGRAKWNWSQFPLRRMCEGALDSIRPLIDSSRVNVVWAVEPEDAAMCGDPASLRRLLLNLLSNSCKHTVDGHIRITIRAIADPDGDWVELQVRDTGEGIPPEILSRLGEAFALNSGFVGAYHVSGTGLGLAICKSIAMAHGGTIVVDSTVGHGTTMTVRLRADLSGPCGVGRNLVRGGMTVADANSRAALQREAGLA